MNNDKLFANLHIALQLSPEVAQIATPLKEYFGVTSIVYGKNYNDGSEIRLTNQPAWIEHYYNNKLYLNSGFERHPSQLQPGYAIWSHLTHHQDVLSAAREFNIDHGFSIINKTPDGCEFYFIGTTTDQHHVTNLLLNNLDFLNRFTFYFKEQAANLIKKVNVHKLIIPNKFKQVVSEEKGLAFKNSLELPSLEVKKYFLDNNVTLSSRELACAKLLMEGKSAKLIAQALSLSPRTIETHLNRLKAKLNCQSKPSLISKLINLNINLL